MSTRVVRSERTSFHASSWLFIPAEQASAWAVLYTSLGGMSRRKTGSVHERWYFNSLVKKPRHKTPYRCPHRLNLSFQSSRSCALPNIKALKDKGLEFANSIRRFCETNYSLFCTFMQFYPRCLQVLIHTTVSFASFFSPHPVERV